METRTSCFSLRLLSIVGTMVLSMPFASFAATLTWTGTGAASTPWNWGTAGNWGGTSYTSGQDLLFTMTNATSGPANRTATNDQVGTTVNSITFNSNNGTYVFTLAGNAITLTNGVSATTSSGSTLFHAIGLSMAIGAGQHTFSMANNHTVTINSSGNLTGAGGVTKTGIGTLSMSTTTSSYTGATIVTAGTLTVGAAGAVSNGGVNGSLGAASTDASNLVLDGGTLAFAASASSSTDRLFSIGTNGGTINSNNSTNSTSINFTGTGSMGFNGTTGTRTLTLGGASTGSNNNISPIIGDNGGATSVTKTGAGRWKLSGANTYTGATTLSQGNLTAGVASVANVSGAFGLNSAITIANAASTNLNLNGFNTQIGSITGGGATGGNVVLGSATLTTGGDNTSPAAYAGVISGTGGVTKIGTGAQAFSGANTYSGTTTLSNGTLQVGVASVGSVGSVTSSAVGTGTLALNGGTLSSDSTTARTLLNPVSIGGDVTLGSATNTGALTFSAAANLGGSARQLTTASNVQFDGVISNGGITKDGSGTMTLTSSNSYAGVTTLTAGTLSVGSIGNGGVAGNLGQASNAASNIVFNGGTLAYTGGNATSDRAFTINDGKTAVIDTGSSNLSLAGATGAATNGALTKTGAGILTLSGNNTFTGATTISQGGLSINGTYASPVTVNANTSLWGTGSFSADVAVSGSHNPGNSPGLQTFTNLTYNTGASVTWELAANTASGAGTNFDQIKVDGTLSFAAPTSLNLSFNTSGAVTWSDPFWSGNQSWLVYDATNATSYSNLALTTANWADSTGALFNTARAGSLFSLSNNGTDLYLNYTAAAIPEPSTYAAIFGLAGLGLAVWRRRRAASARTDA